MQLLLENFTSSGGGSTTTSWTGVPQVVTGDESPALPPTRCTTAVVEPDCPPTVVAADHIVMVDKAGDGGHVDGAAKYLTPRAYNDPPTWRLRRNSHCHLRRDIYTNRHLTTDKALLVLQWNSCTQLRCSIAKTRRNVQQYAVKTCIKVLLLVDGQAIGHRL